MKSIKSKNLLFNTAKEINTTYQYVEIPTEYNSKITLNCNSKNNVFKTMRAKKYLRHDTAYVLLKSQVSIFLVRSNHKKVDMKNLESFLESSS